MEKSIAALIFITVGILSFLVAYANVPLEGGPIITPPPKPMVAPGQTPPPSEAPGYGAPAGTPSQAPARGWSPGY